jgi:hypothetical protein
MSRRVRATVQQVLGEAQGKSEVEIIGAASSSGSTAAHAPHQATGTTWGQGCVAILNLQQPYY